MEDRFERETHGLIRSWMSRDRAELREYLVEDVEDPRVNVQSILTRHFLIEDLLPGRFADLKEQELRFGLVMNWLARTAGRSGGDEAMDAALNALLEGAGEAEGSAIPGYVAETFAMLPAEADGIAVPNYLIHAIIERPSYPTELGIDESVLATFEPLWRELVAHEHPPPISVLEMACGSANDYRFLDAFGIAEFLDYTGLDLCEKNVLNAREMFPEVSFGQGNAMEIDAPDDAFDCSFVHDLFEHLSIEAMERAISELCRVTRRRLCVGFFNMHDGEQHVVRPVDEYHWNRLALGLTRAVFEQHASAVETIHIDTFLRSRFGCGETHNTGAYTFIVEKRGERGPGRTTGPEKHHAAGARSAASSHPRSGLGTVGASSSKTPALTTRDADLAATDYLKYLHGHTFSTDHDRILLACFPKSGSTYLAGVFGLLPGYVKAPLVAGYGRREQELSVEKLLIAHRAHGNYIAQHHVRCSAATERLIERFSLKPVVLVRNIFDVIASIEDHLRGEAPVISQAYVPEDIRDWDEERVRHFIVDMIVPWYLNFFASWSEFDDKLLVTYEDINADVIGVVGRMSDHYRLNLAEGDIRAAVARANGPGADTRRNRAVVGRGNSLPESVRGKIVTLSRYYEGIDFARIGV